eukprot:XP_001707014.1 Hypothetical protein GL50803_26017 [Giardia lamblia ATCC 50803]
MYFSVWVHTQPIFSAFCGVELNVVGIYAMNYKNCVRSLSTGCIDLSCPHYS